MSEEEQPLQIYQTESQFESFPLKERWQTAGLTEGFLSLLPGGEGAEAEAAGGSG